MKPKEPIIHEIKHDLESVFFVLLHIACFTCGPTGTSTSGVKLFYRVAQWHHATGIDKMKDMKMVDIDHLNTFPLQRITEYWAPIAPYIQELIDVIYSGTPSFRSGNNATFEAFRGVLVKALDHCRTLKEDPLKYAAFRPLVTAKKRTRTKSAAQELPAKGHPATKLMRVMKDGDITKLPRNTRIMPFTQYQDSAAMDSEN